MGNPGRFVSRFLGFALAALQVGACLLYTDTINEPPTVMIVAPDHVYASSKASSTARFEAMIEDPNGDDIETVSWLRADKKCDEVAAGDWSVAASTGSRIFEIAPKPRQQFCVRVVATDEHGANGASERSVVVENRAPTAAIQMIAPTPQERPFALFSAFRLSAERSEDPDGDKLVYSWKLDRADVTLAACETAGVDVLRCFVADKPGAYAIALTVDDGRAKSEAVSLSLSVAEDHPACLEATMPDVNTPMVPLFANEPFRRFSVLRVRDESHPHPPGPAGGTLFYWFVAQRLDGPWERLLGQSGPSLDVGISLFDDPGPGALLRVRVEVRDPAHDRPERLPHGQCGESRLCELPAGCLRWAGWTVRVQ